MRELQDFMETIRLWEREREKKENLKLIKEKDERFLPKKNENLEDPYFFFFIIIPLDCPSIQNASVFPSRIKNPVTCNWHGSNYDRLWNNNFFGEGRGTRVSSIKVETDRGGKNASRKRRYASSYRFISRIPENCHCE